MRTGELSPVRRILWEELLFLSIDEGDDSLLDTLVQELAEVLKTLGELEFDLTLSGPYDERNAIVALHAGAGGVESQDWASMLMRMYLRWAEQRSFRRDVLDVSVGDEGGVKSAVFQVSGRFAYGYLQAERGVHRLVRMSPFDSDHARHTSFALMEVLPEVEEGVDVTVNPDDLRIDVFRAGGAWRAECTEELDRRADNAPSYGHPRELPERALTAPEPRDCDANPDVTSGGARDG